MPAAQVSEQNPTENQQSDSLPEGNLPPSEQSRPQPIPQMRQKFSAISNENHDRWRDQKKDSSLLQIVLLFPRNLVVNALQSLVQEKRRVALLQQEGIDVRTVFAKTRRSCDPPALELRILRATPREVRRAQISL